MAENGKILPTGVLRVDDIAVASYAPMEIRTNGVCLALGVLFAGMLNSPYEFDFLLLRHARERIFSEPLVYRDMAKLSLKQLCQDIQNFMNGELGSVYVQMHDKKTGNKVGASFWNMDTQLRSFNIAYHVSEEFSEKKLSSFVNQVYFAFLNNYETLMQKMALPDGGAYNHVEKE